MRPISAVRYALTVDASLGSMGGSTMLATERGALMRATLRRLADQANRAEAAYRASLVARDRFIAEAHGELPTAEIAEIVGLARQRVYEIVKGTELPGGKGT